MKDLVQQASSVSELPYVIIIISRSLHTRATKIALYIILRFFYHTKMIFHFLACKKTKTNKQKSQTPKKFHLLVEAAYRFILGLHLIPDLIFLPEGVGEFCMIIPFVMNGNQNYNDCVLQSPQILLLLISSDQNPGHVTPLLESSHCVHHLLLKYVAIFVTQFPFFFLFYFISVKFHESAYPKILLQMILFKPYKY